MFTRADHIAALTAALLDVASRAEVGMDLDDWLAVLDLLDRLSAYPGEDLDAAGVSDLVTGLSRVRDAGRDRVRKLAGDGSPFFDLDDEGDALSQGTAEEPCLAWGMDVARLAGALPWLGTDAGSAADGVVARAVERVQSDPVPFLPLTTYAARRIELEDVHAQAAPVRKVLDAFLALPVVAREDADLADLLPGPALLGALHRAAVAAARSVALPDGVVLLRGATPVEDQRLAAKESGHPPVSPGDWLVVYRSDLAAVSVAEVGERGAPTFVAIELVLGPAAPEGLRLDAAGVVVAWSGAKPCTPIGALQRGKARWEAWFRDLLPDRIEVQGLAEVFALDLRRLDGV